MSPSIKNDPINVLSPDPVEETLVMPDFFDVNQEVADCGLVGECLELGDVLVGHTDGLDLDIQNVASKDLFQDLADAELTHTIVVEGGTPRLQSPLVGNHILVGAGEESAYAEEAEAVVTGARSEFTLNWNSPSGTDSNVIVA